MRPKGVISYSTYNKIIYSNWMYPNYFNYSFLAAFQKLQYVLSVSFKSVIFRIRYTVCDLNRQILEKNLISDVKILF